MEGDWDRFCRSHPQASPFHLIAWRNIIAQSFGYEALYLLAQEDGAVTGVLPLFAVQNFLIGKTLISAPFAVYAGILAATESAREALRVRAQEIAAQLGVSHLELRNAHPEQCAGFSRLSRYVTFTQPVFPQTSDELLESLPKKTRNMVRKALKHPYSSRIATSTDAFYELLLRTYRRLGTPVFPKSYFDRVTRELGEHADVREIVLGEKVVAASLNLLFRGEMHTFYAASDPAYLPMAANNFLYFDHLLWAGQNGFHTFDFGRSKLNTGTLEFKRHWLTTMRELPYEMLLVRSKEMPNFTPQNARFGAAIRMWQKVPLPLTRIIGPRLVRLFP
jgi:FemAB-related protein (PEP-CTERM system-associated)